MPITIKKWLLVLLCSIPIIGHSLEIEDIRLIGVQRVAPSTIFNMLPDGVIGNPDKKIVNRIIKRLFASGYFKDIELLYDHKTLIIKLQEHPTISDIQLEGNKQIPTKPLLKVLQQEGIGKGNLLKAVTLNAIHQSLKQQYHQIGYYGAKVRLTQTLVGDNTILLAISIDEGKSATVKGIRFVGNEKFSDTDLQHNFTLHPKDQVSFFSRDGHFNQQIFFSSINKLQQLYRDNGYTQATVSGYNLALSKDYQHVYVTVTINEGTAYTITDTQINLTTTHTDISLEDIRALVTIKTNSIYSKTSIDRAKNNIISFLGYNGYFLASVNVLPKIEASGKMRLEFNVHPGQHGTVNKITFIGNDKTKDSILRRELRQFEGAPANPSLIERSTQRLQRLPYIKNIRFNHRPVANSDDKIDLIYNLEEQFSGTISANLSYSSFSKSSLGFTYSENNIFGSGMSSTIGAQFGAVVTKYNLSILDPYFTPDNVSLRYSFSYTKRNFNRAKVGNYATNTVGGRITFGYPTNENTRLNFGLFAKEIELIIGDKTHLEIKKFDSLYGNTFNEQGFYYALTHDTLNLGFMPTAGGSETLSIEASIPGSDFLFYKTRLNVQHYLPLYKDKFILHARSEIGYIDNYNSTKHTPLFENFYAGGHGSLRGYNNNSIGPKLTNRFGNKSSTSAGGNILVAGGLELIFPHFWKTDTIRTLLFFDIAQVYNHSCLLQNGDTTTVTKTVNDTNEDGSLKKNKNGTTKTKTISADGQVNNSTCDNKVNVSYDTMRKSWGLALVWFTPMVPLQFSLSKPIDKQENDKTTSFQFTLGYGF